MSILYLFCVSILFSFSNGHHESRDPELFVGAVVSDPKYPEESKLVFKRSKLALASGHSVNLFNDIVFALNLKSNIVKGAGWGSKLEDGSWDGALGQLESGEIDIFASQATFLPEKAQEFRLMPPTFKGQYYVYFRTPRGFAYEKVFTRSFSKAVWFATIAVFVIIAICTWSLSNCYAPGAASDPKYSASDVLISCFAIFTEQGIPFMPNKTSLRISLIVNSLCVVIISTAYSAQLVSIFSLHETGIHSFADVQKRLVLKGDSATPFVQGLVYGTNKSHLQHPGFLIDTNLAVQEVMKTSSAFLTFEGFPRAVMLKANLSFRQYCNQVMRVKALKTIRWSGMVMLKEHPGTEKVKQTVMKILERGLNYRYEKNAEYSNCKREPKLEHPHVVIEIESILVLLFTLMAAYICSVSLMLYEVKRMSSSSFQVYIP